MSDGEIAYLVLVLVAFSAFAAVLFAQSHAYAKWKKLKG